MAAWIDAWILKADILRVDLGNVRDRKGGRKAAGTEREKGKRGEE